jgi:hypothetical protein
MGVLNWITQGCDALTATASPTIDALGVRMCIALATIMLVWFGVQESLASTHGGQGFHMGKFLSFFMLISFAYTLVRFYDSSIPGVGQSFRGFINGGAQYLVSVIGSDSITSIQNTLNQAQATSGPGMVKALMNPYYAIVYVIIQVLIATFSAAVSAIVAYGAIASAVVGLLGPVFIPFLVFDKLEFLFWGWLRAFIGFCFYKVLAAAVLSILAHLLAQYYTELVNFSDPGNMVQELPLLNARTTAFRTMLKTAACRTSMWRSRMSSWMTFDSRRIRRASSSRRCTPTPRIILNSSGSDGQPASPMSFARM